MNFKYMYVFLAGVAPLGMAGCASVRSEKPVSVDSVETLAPDSLSNINLDVTLQVPQRAFSGRSRLIIVPQLMEDDSLIAECTPVVLDAPIFSKKMERRKRLEGYVDPLAGNARRADHRQEYRIPYREQVPVPEGIQGGRVIAVVSTDGCGECSAVDTVELARVSNIPALIATKKSLKLNWIEPEFVIRPKVMEGRGEARLQFIINRHDINLTLGHNKEEMNRMLSVLENIVKDSLAVLNTVDIYGMASADGSFGFNTALARNRANSARNWLVERLGLTGAQQKGFSIGSRPEGWYPVLEAMTADGHPDSLKVKEILDRYNAENDDVAERYIRRLSCWSDIRAKYLQKDRKVEYVYTYTIKSFTTDAELLDMYGKRPDAFNEEELLRVSTLKQTHEEKKEVYRTILHYFPQSQVAANNLAVLLLREDKPEEAEAVLNTLKEYSPEVLNTKAAVYVYRNEYEKAVELLRDNKELPEARYNLALIRAKERKIDEAARLMEGYEDTNAAILSLCVGRLTEADAIMRRCGDETPLAEYVRTLVAARKRNRKDFYRHLPQAVKEARLKERAATETDFIPYSGEAEFKALTGKGGEQ